MSKFFRVVLLVKSLIAVGGFGWAIGMNFSGAGTTRLAAEQTILQNAAFATEASRPAQQWRFGP